MEESWSGALLAWLVLVMHVTWLSINDVVHDTGKDGLHPK